MIGKLTIDKSSMNISYFLYTIKIIVANGGKISRQNFVKEMSKFVGVPAKQNNKENRTAYNKSKLPRYFGFVDVIVDEQGTNYLILTHRGYILSNYIKDNGENKQSSVRFSIENRHKSDFIDLIFDSVVFDSFGKNNSGAEQSSTDVEPPKIVFKTIYELGKATAEEICYVMFGLNKGLFPNFEEAIKKVKENRLNAIYDYSKIMKEWSITNIVNDCKIINIFTDSNISLLISEKNVQNGRVYYQLGSMLSESHKKQLKTISAVYEPLQLFVYTNGDEATVENWVDGSVLGRVSDNSQIIKYNFGRTAEPFCFNDSQSDFVPGAFEKAVLQAFQNEKRNIYFVVQNITESSFISSLGKYAILLNRLNDVKNEKHGWSKEQLKDKNFYTWLISKSNRAKNLLNDEEVKLPSNLHIVGTVIMNNKSDSTTFDYEFRRCLIDTSSIKGKNANNKPVCKYDSKKCVDYINLIVYGTPGCGKSYYVKNTLLKDYRQENIIRTTFYQDYTNTDFVGQILPTVSGSDVTYKFNPGPFTLALERAIKFPNEPVALVIEELNRGNAASIFGDIFQLLDRDNGKSEYQITNVNIQKYLSDNIDDKLFEYIMLPANLTIVATMNTSDQNVFTLDTAFKRRWDFKKMKNKFEGDHPYKDYYVPGMMNITWEAFVNSINSYIVSASSDLQSEDKQLGVFFVSEELLRKTETAEEREKTEKFAYKVLEYLWDDVAKFDRDTWFNDKIKSLDELVEMYVTSGKEVFKDGIFKQQNS